jgi:hypothetical protein
MRGRLSKCLPSFAFLEVDPAVVVVLVSCASAKPNAAAQAAPAANIFTNLVCFIFVPSVLVKRLFIKRICDDPFLTLLIWNSSHAQEPALIDGNTQ